MPLMVHRVSGGQTDLGVNLTSTAHIIILGQSRLSKPQPSLLTMGQWRSVPHP